MDNGNVYQGVKKTLAKEVFLHLLAIFTLYGSATSFGVLLFQYINHFFPNPQSFEIGRQILAPLRFAISTLLVVYPVFITVSWFLNKSYFKDEARREFRLRKWLIYFTLFVAAIVIIGDLVNVINGFLGGEITLRFVLQAVSVFLIAGLVFGYYLNDVRRVQPSRNVRRFVLGVSALIAAAVIGGFFIAGSPAKERLFRFDEQRVSDLQMIQSQIVNFWQRKERLPDTLDELNDTISGYKAPVDPQTAAAYEYGKKAELIFELCATFNLPGGQQINRAPFYPHDLGQTWEHKEGRVCFERSIDKELYPPLQEPAR